MNRQPLIPIFLGLLISVTWLVGCIERKPRTATEKESPVSARLSEMVEREEFLGVSGDDRIIGRNELNEKHRREVYEFLAQSLITAPADLYHAALILSNAESESAAEACLMAHYLALEAAREGLDTARSLAARALDRYLVLSSDMQRYGTQYYVDSAGVAQLFPVDPAITDSERVAWGIDSLPALRRRLDTVTVNSRP